MTECVVRMWNDSFSESVCGVVDWSDGCFSARAGTALANALLSRGWTHVTVLSEPHDKHWVVMSWRYDGSVHASCESARSMLERSILPDFMTGRWRVFREKIHPSLKPQWVVWDTHGEYMFPTGSEALAFVNDELNKRYWGQLVGAKMERRGGVA